MPDAMKVVTGNAGKRAIDLTVGVQPVVTLPDCPRQLSARAKRIWQTLGPQLVALGLMAEIYSPKFALLCQAVDEWWTWLEKIKDLEKKQPESGYIQLSPNGYSQISPWVVLRDRAAERVAKHGAAFGLSPADVADVQASANQGSAGDEGATPKQDQLDGMPEKPTKPTLAYFSDRARKT